MRAPICEAVPPAVQVSGDLGQDIGPTEASEAEEGRRDRRLVVHAANADLAAEVRTEVAGHGAWRAEPSGPPALKRLSEELADPLKPWELAGTCFQLA